MKIDKSKLAGMTTNERLFVCGLLPEYDAAYRKSDKIKLEQLLKKVQVNQKSIDKIIGNI